MIKQFWCLTIVIICMYSCGTSANWKQQKVDILDIYTKESCSDNGGYFIESHMNSKTVTIITGSRWFQLENDTIVRKTTRKSWKALLSKIDIDRFAALESGIDSLQLSKTCNREMSIRTTDGLIVKSQRDFDAIFGTEFLWTEALFMHYHYKMFQH